jgi:hypothetical protein
MRYGAHPSAGLPVDAWHGCLPIMNFASVFATSSLSLLLCGLGVGCAEGSSLGNGGSGGGSDSTASSAQGGASQGGAGQGGAGSQTTGSTNSAGGGGQGGQGGAPLVCDEGLTPCGDECVELQTDLDHCGSCSNLCGAPLDNTAPTCAGGMCGVECSPGFSDCNGDLAMPNSDGCEVDTSVSGCTYTFAYTGAPQSFTVPAGTTSLQFSVAGAQGGSGLAANTNYGGLVTGTLSVSPGDVLQIFVGEQPVGTLGGFNGGGAGDGAGRGGGGASDIRLNGMTLTDRVVVAGGGGGGGFWSVENVEVVGGQGGGLQGTAGLRLPDNPGGQAGTQTGSGTGTCVSFDVAAMGGGLGFGGTPLGSSCGCDGYGGGGGYWGGAGSGNCRGGGGGSGFTGSAASNVVHTVGGAPPGHGSVSLTLL